MCNWLGALTGGGVASLKRSESKSSDAWDVKVISILPPQKQLWRTNAASPCFYHKQRSESREESLPALLAECHFRSEDGMSSRARDMTLANTHSYVNKGRRSTLVHSASYSCLIQVDFLLWAQDVRTHSPVSQPRTR